MDVKLADFKFVDSKNRTLKRSSGGDHYKTFHAEPFIEAECFEVDLKIHKRHNLMIGFVKEGYNENEFIGETEQHGWGFYATEYKCFLCEDNGREVKGMKPFQSGDTIKFVVNKAEKTIHAKRNNGKARLLYDSAILPETLAIGVSVHFERSTVEIINYSATFDPVRCFRKGNELFKAGKYKKAIDYYNKSIETSPKFVPAYLNRSNVFSRLGDQKKALLDLTTALNYGEDYRIYFNRGVIFMNMKSFGRAVQDFSNALKLKPRDHDALNNRGNVYYNLKKYDLALKDYKRSARSDRTDYVVFMNLGNCHFKMGNFKDSIREYNRAAELNRDDFRVFLRRGFAYKNLKRFRAAKENFLRVDELRKKRRKSRE